MYKKPAAWPKTRQSQDKPRRNMIRTHFGSSPFLKRMSQSQPSDDDDEFDFQSVGVEAELDFLCLGVEPEPDIDFLSVGAIQHIANVDLVSTVVASSAETELVKLDPEPTGRKRGRPTLFSECIRGTTAQRRSSAQHALVMMHARHAKEKIRLQREVTESRSSIQSVADAVNSSSSAAIVSVGSGSFGVVIRSGQKLSKPLSPAGIRRIAFDYRCLSTKGTAHILQVAPITITVAQTLMAGCALHYLEIRLKAFCDHITKAPSMQRNLCFVYALSWDESTKLLTLPLSKHLSDQQRKARWHVLVSLQRIAFVSSLASGAEQSYFKQLMELPRANVPVMSTSCEDIAHGLFEVPMTRHINDFVSALQGYCEVGFHHFSRDGASSGLKLVELRSQYLEAKYSNVLMSDHVCSLHSNALVTGVVMKDFLPTIASIYSAATVCRTGSTFLRIIHAVAQHVHENLEVHLNVTPPAGCSAFSAELRDYAVLHYDTAGGGGKAKQHRTRRKGRELFLRDWADLTDVLNGRLWLPMLEHYCTSTSCCQGQTRSVTVSTIVRALLKCIFRSPPSSPNLGKWKKWGPSLDSFILSFLVHRSYTHTCSISLSEWRVHLNTSTLVMARPSSLNLCIGTRCRVTESSRH